VIGEWIYWMLYSEAERIFRANSKPWASPIEQAVAGIAWEVIKHRPRSYWYPILLGRKRALS
jgi:hypothetical protein